MITVATPAELFKTPATTVTDFPFPDHTLDMAYIKVHGRYPEKDLTINHKCHEVCYILEGQGRINDHELTPGLAVQIPPGEPYYFEGNFTMIVSCTPKFSPDQVGKYEN